MVASWRCRCSVGSWVSDCGRSGGHSTVTNSLAAEETYSQVTHPGGCGTQVCPVFVWVAALQGGTAGLTILLDSCTMLCLWLPGAGLATAWVEHPPSGGVMLRSEWGDPCGGSAAEHIYLHSPDVMYKENRLTVGGETVRFKAVFRRM